MELLPQALSASFVQLTVQAALISGPYSRVCYLTSRTQLCFQTDTALATTISVEPDVCDQHEPALNGSMLRLSVAAGCSKMDR